MVYPPNFALAFSTSYSPSTSLSSISTTVQFQSNASSQVSVLAFPINTTSRRAGQSCPLGYEWRYTKVGSPAAFACNCPANKNCSGITRCNIVPTDGEQWHVVMVPKELCNPGETQFHIVLMKIWPQSLPDCSKHTVHS